MRTGIGRVAALAAIALGVWAPAGQAAPGDFDESFGAGGKKTYDFGGPDGAFGLRIQADGKLVLGGYAGVRPNLAAFRLLPGGLPDTSFSADGLASFAFNVETRARALALQPDGKIVLAGQTVVAGDDIAIGRLNTDGTPDGTFSDATGKRTLNLFGSDSAAAVLVQPDGGIIVAGHGGANSNLAQARFTPAGAVDFMFGSLGQSEQNLGGSEVGWGGAQQPDGKIVTVGSTSQGSNVAFSRINANGSPDTGVDATGAVAFNIGGADIGRAVALLPDGKMLIAGTGGAGNDMFVLKLNADATFDGTFGTDGFTTIDLGGVDDARAIAVQANGKIVVAGSTTSGANTDVAVVRLQPGGALDATFGAGGKRTIDFGRLDTGYALALQPNGKIVVAGVTGGGAAGEDMAVARLDGDAPSTGGGPGGGGDGTGGGKTKVYRCGGKRATIIGTNRRNRLKGTKRADVIVALGGNDRVDGRGGNDIICAGSGNDSAAGGPGKDRLYGDSGKDALKGGDGNDSLDGGSGNDKLFGESGKDTLRGRSGRDRLAGGPGRDKQKQ